MENKLNIKNIEQKVQELGLNQTTLAREMQVSKEAVSKWLRNEKYPRPDKLIRLARLLNLSFSELVCKTPTANEPVIAFRKKGAHKITSDYIEQAKDMGTTLKELVHYLPFDDLSQPAVLKSPLVDYEYIQKVAKRVRKRIGVREGEEIRFDHLIGFFNELQAVIIPVLWGNKENHENALHIYLPESMTTWIYLNLDCRIHDFKF
ncbi:MAG TPA: helix-turn-helix transcriptional regulator, partial [Smithella sp.]|nr:helix-turn-helix transcriptional regulator [Smithella sp.]